MTKGSVILLCNLTLNAAQPWLDAGHAVYLIDPQHPAGSHSDQGNPLITRVGCTIIEAAEQLGRIMRSGPIAFVMGFPPCTDVAVSGATHFKSKRDKDVHFQAKAALVAEQCRMIGMLSGAPWLFENPISVFSSIFGTPNYIFNPYEYGGYLPEDDVHPEFPKYIAPRDAYPKKTCLWTGGGLCDA